MTDTDDIGKVDFLKFDFLTPNEVADIFEVKARTVRTWLNEGTMYGVKLPTGGWRIPKDEVKRFANNKYGD